MNKILLYSYSKCSTCRKAINFLKENNISFELIDIVVNPPSKRILTLALAKIGKEKKRLFNTRGKSFKDSKISDIETLSDESIVNLLYSDGKLIKRPFLIIENKEFIFGFNEVEYIKCLFNS